MAPCTPALAAPLSNTGDWRFVHVLPIESVTVVKSFVDPPLEELSAATHRTINAPAWQFAFGDNVNEVAPVLCVPVPLAVADSVTRESFHRHRAARLTPR